MNLDVPICIYMCLDVPSYSYMYIYVGLDVPRRKPGGYLDQGIVNQEVNLINYPGYVPGHIPWMVLIT